MILEVCWDGLWTLSFGLSQCHGHGSWLVCEVALNKNTRPDEEDSHTVCCPFESDLNLYWEGEWWLSWVRPASPDSRWMWDGRLRWAWWVTSTMQVVSSLPSPPCDTDGEDHRRARDTLFRNRILAQKPKKWTNKPNQTKRTVTQSLHQLPVTGGFHVFTWDSLTNETATGRIDQLRVGLVWRPT